MIEQVFVDTDGDKLTVGVCGDVVSLWTMYPEQVAQVLFFKAHQIDAITAALQMARDAAG